MANNKLYGYTPKMSNEKDGNRLDNLNPYEFRKGMDYELTAVGCMRLAESTPEERETATEKVIKNLESHPGYYSGLIQFEGGMNHAGKIDGKNFKSWLKDHYELNKMQPVVDEKFAKSKKTNFKDDKMKELKEAVRREIKLALLEADDLDVDMDPDAADKAATKAAKKATKGKTSEPKKSANRFDNEIKALENLLWKGENPESESTKNDPAEGTLLYIRTTEWESHKEKRDAQGLTIKDWEATLKQLNKDIGEKKVLAHVAEWGPRTEENPKAAGNEGATKDNLMGEDFFQTVKNLEKRIDTVKKEKEADIKKSLGETKEFAQYQMERADHIRLLEICKEGGVSLREGSMTIRPYYEIAKSAYLEGLSKGLKL
jgi:hypothetical protein